MTRETRYHGLDLLRAVAMLLGLVLHAPLVLTVPEVFAEVLPEATATPPEPDAWVWMIVIWIHLWRMPLFFLLAGFFAALVIDRKGWRAFAADRAVRIFAALVVFQALFASVFSRPFAKLDHLWFLWFLTIFCAAAVLWSGARMPRGAALGRRSAGLAAFGAILLAAAFREDQLWHQIPEYVWDLEIEGLLYYGAFFVAGHALYNGRALFADLAQPAAFLSCLLVAQLGYVLLLLTIEEGLPPLRAIGSGLMTWGMCFGLIGLSLRLLRGPNRFVQWLVAGSYPIYLFHLYPILIISAVMIEAGATQGAIMAVVPVAGFAVALGLWYALVRYTPLDWLLNGYRKAWFKRPWHPNGWVTSQTQKAAPLGGPAN